MIKRLRANQISSEIYPTAAKMKKQMKYANDRDVKRIALVGAGPTETRRAGSITGAGVGQASLRGRLRDRNALREAFILKELLEPPVSMRG